MRVITLSTILTFLYIYIFVKKVYHSFFQVFCIYVTEALFEPATSVMLLHLLQTLSYRINYTFVAGPSIAADRSSRVGVPENPPHAYRQQEPKISKFILPTLSLHTSAGLY